MEAVVAHLDTLTRYRPQDFVVRGKENFREAEDYAATRHDDIGYLAVRGRGLVCRYLAPFDMPMATNIPLFFGPERAEHRKLFRQWSAELQPFVEQFQGLGEEEAIAPRELDRSFVYPGGYALYIASRVGAWWHNRHIEKRRENGVYAGQAYESVGQVDAVLALVDEIEAESLRPEAERGGERAQLILRAQAKLVQWEREEADWTVAGRRALAELWCVLLQYRADAGVQLLIEVQRQAAVGFVARDRIDLEHYLTERLADTHQRVRILSNVTGRGMGKGWLAYLWPNRN